MTAASRPRESVPETWVATGIEGYERTIREFHLESGGIRVGEPLRDFRGVLTGVPVVEGADGPLRERKSL